MLVYDKLCVELANSSNLLRIIGTRVKLRMNDDGLYSYTDKTHTIDIDRGNIPPKPSRPYAGHISTILAG